MKLFRPGVLKNFVPGTPDEVKEKPGTQCRIKLRTEETHLSR
jgi:hypothetical protein